jgi:hypothetical protein
MHLIGYREITPLDDVLEESEWQHHKDYKLYVADHKSHTLKDGSISVDEYDTRLTIASGGHLCLADEAWHKWPARGWSRTSEGILFYFSMVRRFGDDFWLQSQRFNDVDSILIDRCQDYWKCRNLGRLRYGRFKLPPIYRVDIFDHRPTESSEPAHSHKFTLDKHGLAECYDTSGGVGVSGRVVADTERKTSGLPIWIILLVGILVIWLLIYAVKTGTVWMHAKLLPKPKPSVIQIANKTQTSAPNEKQQDHETSHALSQSENQTSNYNSDDLPPVEMSGYYEFCGKYTVMLTDGTIYESGDSDLKLLTKKYCVIGTNVYHLHHYDPRISPAPPLYYSHDQASSTIDTPVQTERQPEIEYVPRPALVYTIPNRSPLDAATGGYRGHPQDISTRFQNQTTSQNHVEIQ